MSDRWAAAAMMAGHPNETQPLGMRNVPIAIQVGGIGALAPTRKPDLARLGLKAVACGTMANFMSACIAGILL